MFLPLSAETRWDGHPRPHTHRTSDGRGPTPPCTPARVSFCNGILKAPFLQQGFLINVDCAIAASVEYTQPSVSPC